VFNVRVQRVERKLDTTMTDWNDVA